MSGCYPSFGILLVDDEPAWLRSLSTALERSGNITNIIECTDSRLVIDELQSNDIGIVLLDLTMPHRSGEELLAEISERFPHVVMIVISGMNQIETAVRCMKLGASDYYVKTHEEDRIVSGVLRAVRMVELQRENQELSRRFLGDELGHPEAFQHICGISKGMRAVLQYVESIAQSSQPVLITGESGVGKELIARAIHAVKGCAGPLVAVNVAGLDDNLFSDTLFGHVKGAYSGADQARKGMVEEAAGGTLFLDEIGDLSQASQVKLLRLLQEGEYFPLGSDRPKRLRARVIASTHQDLAKKHLSGEFRKDLYYRLQIHKVRVPPLRERKEDIPVLLDMLLDEAAAALHKKKPSIPPELLVLLETHPFPGNVRELRAMAYEALSRHKGGVLSMEAFLDAMGREHAQMPPDAAHHAQPFRSLAVLPTIQASVACLIDEAMRRAKGNQSIAARMLGISQPARSKRLKQLRGGQPVDSAD